MKRSIWSVKTDPVAGIQDANMLCVLAHTWTDVASCVGGRSNDGDIVDPVFRRI